MCHRDIWQYGNDGDGDGDDGNHFDAPVPLLLLPLPTLASGADFADMTAEDLVTLGVSEGSVSMVDGLMQIASDPEPADLTAAQV